MTTVTKIAISIKNINKPPPPFWLLELNSKISDCGIEEIPFKKFDGFQIIPSETSGRLNLPLTPDFAMCDDCKKEILEKKDYFIKLITEANRLSDLDKKYNPLVLGFESSEEYYKYFSKLEGNQHIANLFAIEKILDIIQFNRPKRILEIGLGIGSISYSVIDYLSKRQSSFEYFGYP